MEVRKLLKTFLSLVLIGWIVSSLLSISYAESSKDVFFNTQYYLNLDNQYFDKYLNYSEFKNTFNQIYGERTGVPVSVLVHDYFEQPNDHGDRMLLVGNRVKVSDDVEFLPVSVVNYTYEDALSFLKENTRVYNASFGVITSKFVDLVTDLQRKGVLVINSAGNDPNAAQGYNTIRNNIHTDNYLVVGQIDIDSKPVIYNGNYDITDFSVYAGVYYDGIADSTGVGGTSAAAITVSTIIAQYYSIRPCWDYKDMKKFIYATLRPTSELGIYNDRTKTKRYLKYDTRIFDDSYVQALNLDTCTGLGSSDTGVSDTGIESILSRIFDRIFNRDNSTNTNNTESNNTISEIDQQLINTYEGNTATCIINKDWYCVIENATNIIQLDPSNAIAYASRALAYRSLGFCNWAIEDVTIARVLDSRNQTVREVYDVTMEMCGG